MLRATGLGYTVVRPGPLKEEPGGYKALVFDQGNRIVHDISCADVADVALKVSFDPHIKVNKRDTVGISSSHCLRPRRLLRRPRHRLRRRRRRRAPGESDLMDRRAMNKW